MGQKLTRQELDAEHSSKERVQRFLELAVNVYNDEEWVPKSTPFSDFHFELDRAIDLPFDKTSDPLTVEQAKAMYTDMRAAMNQALFNWKASGRGEGRRDDNDVIYRFNGTIYFQTGNDSDDENDNVEYVNDNRSDFINGNLSVGYFWCLLESHGLVSACSQNCEAIGMTMDNIRETSNLSCIKSKNGKSKRNTIESDILTSVESMMSSNNEVSFAMHNQNHLYEKLIDATDFENQA